MLRSLTSAEIDAAVGGLDMVYGFGEPVAPPNRFEDIWVRILRGSLNF